MMAMMSIGNTTNIDDDDDESTQFNFADNLTKGVQDLQKMALNVNKLDRVTGTKKNDWIND